jgi:purine-nucleoside phosphorylase
MSQKILSISPKLSLSKTALIISHPLDIKLFLEFMPKPEKKQSLALAKLYLFSSLTLVGPCLGRPQLFLILEHLYTWGARRFIFWGWCGGINEKLKIGDLVIPKEARDKEVSFASEGLLKEVKNHIKMPFFEGSIFTLDNPYVLERPEIASLSAQGITAIDMETEGLFRWIDQRKAEAVAILVVSDLLYTPKWTPGFSHPSFKQTRRAVAMELKKMFFNGNNL